MLVNPEKLEELDYIWGYKSTLPWEKGEDQEGFLGNDSNEEGERGAKGQQGVPNSSCYRHVVYVSQRDLLVMIFHLDWSLYVYQLFHDRWIGEGNSLQRSWRKLMSFFLLVNFTDTPEVFLNDTFHIWGMAINTPRFQCLFYRQINNCLTKHVMESVKNGLHWQIHRF